MFDYRIKIEEASEYEFVNLPRIYTIRDQYFENILDSYPKFKKMLKIRALRRNRYFKKLEKQVGDLRKMGKDKFRRGSFKKDRFNFKPARLIED